MKRGLKRRFFLFLNSEPQTKEVTKMSVFRVEKTKGYTVMSNHHLPNHTLSLKAKGLLSQMLSLPDDWGITRCRGLRRSTKRASTPSAKLCASWNVPVTSSAAGSVTSVAACAEPSTRSTSSRTQSQHRKNLRRLCLHWIIQRWKSLCWINLRWKIQRN